MSTFESTRCMTIKEQTAYDLGYADGKEDAIKHGKWKQGMKCTQCGQVDFSKPNYCPQCGAKMDLE